MGYEFPNEIIKGFIEQGPSVQQSTIDLLARVSAGEQLVSGNLLQLFDGLGHNVPMSMIMSMADLEPEAQQGTINLLNQIAAGYDFTAEDLLNRFEELGLELPSFLQNALESENENTREQAVELLEQLLNAEESERGEILERLFDLGTDSGKKGLVPGINSQQDSVKTSGANLANKAPEGASSVDAPGQMENIGENTGSGFLGGLQRAWDTVTSWVSGAVNGLVGLFEGILDIGSPSRVLEKIGEYTIEGFNIGMENMMPEGYRSISEWIDNIVNGASGLKIQAPKLDLSIYTSKYRFQPANIDADKIQGEVRESLDYLFSEDAGIIDYDRLGEAVYQAQVQAMKENPVQIGDDDIFKSAQRGQGRYFKRTHKTGFAGI